MQEIRCHFLFCLHWIGGRPGIPRYPNQERNWLLRSFPWIYNFTFKIYQKTSLCVSIYQQASESHPCEAPDSICEAKTKEPRLVLLTMNPMDDFPSCAKTSKTLRKLPIENDGHITDHPLLMGEEILVEMFVQLVSVDIAERKVLHCLYERLWGPWMLRDMGLWCQTG